MTDEAQGIPHDITPEEVCRLVTGALYPKEMALLQETQRQLDEERRMLDETRERCKALESELSSARMRIDKPLLLLIAINILVFVVGTAMEVFKTSMGSWTYPEAAIFRIEGVPLFSGFMYATVGSYLARVSRLFDFRFTRHPPIWSIAAPSVARRPTPTSRSRSTTPAPTRW